MKTTGYAAPRRGAALELIEYELPPLAPEHVQIRISHCGICHSDIHLIDDDWGMSRFPFVPGHEILGAVSAVGSAVKHLREGDRVGVGWQSDSCGECEWCRKGDESLCTAQQATCVQRNGGYAADVQVDARFAISIPPELPSDIAAPLMCGGITVYSPLRTHGVGPGTRVGVIGIGGLGHLALQFARALGAEVTAFSTSPDKATEARRFGAQHFVTTRDKDSLAHDAHSLDFLISSVSADLDWPAWIDILRPRGTLCFVGASPAPIQIPVFSLIMGERKLAGSAIGSPDRIAEMLALSARAGITTAIERYPMSQVNAGLERVRKNQARYRVVLEN